MKRRIISILLVLMMIVSLAACGSSTSSSTDGTASDDYEEFSLEVAGTEVTYTKVPERVIAINYECAQELVALGLTDRIIGITPGHFKLDECLPEYQKEMSGLKDLGANISYETILAENPDFVYAHPWTFTAESTATPEEYIKDGIAIYGVKGDSQDVGTFEYYYDDLRNLGKIFGVEDRAEEIIAETQKRVDEVVKNAVKDAPTVFVYDSGDKQAYTAGNSAMQSEMLRLVGAKNIFDDIDAKYEEVSWEEVAERNPQWILINEYEDENQLNMTKKEFLKTNPALENCDAVKNDRFISINLLDLREGLNAINGLEATLEALKAK